MPENNNDEKPLKIGRFLKWTLGAALVAGVLPMGMAWHMAYPRTLNLADVTLANGEISYYIDQAKQSSNSLKIRGWAMQRGQPSDIYRIAVVLKSPDHSYVYPAKIEYRHDVTAVFAGDNCDYKISGFNTRITTFFLPRQDYELCLLYQGKERQYLVNTQQIFHLAP